MATNLSLSINLSEIDKTKLFKGEKGVYLDIFILMYDDPNKYGQCGMAAQNWKDKPKDEKGAILGNLKWIEKKDSTPAPVTQVDIDSLPF